MAFQRLNQYPLTGALGIEVAGVDEVAARYTISTINRFSGHPQSCEPPSIVKCGAKNNAGNAGHIDRIIRQDQEHQRLEQRRASNAEKQQVEQRPPTTDAAIGAKSMLRSKGNSKRSCPRRNAEGLPHWLRE